MFEDEMTEDHIVRTDDEYRRVTEQEIADEKLAQFKSIAASLQALACLLC
jgi:hypothetical protein